MLVELVDEDCRPSGWSQARGGVGFAALGRDPQLVDRGRASRCSSLASCRNSLAQREASAMILRSPLPSMAEALDRLAGLADALDHATRPARLDADDHHRGDVGVAAGADQGAEVQIQVLAELQAPVGWGSARVAVDVAWPPSQAALERSSSGRMMTWLRMPTRPFSRR
jgi:hypothetical protein